MNSTGRKNQRKFEKALLALLKRQPFDTITVQDICKEAGLSRTTFYHHYARTDDALLTA